MEIMGIWVRAILGIIIMTLIIVVVITLSPILITLTIIGLKQYDKFLDKLKKQNRYLTQTELEERLKIQKGTFLVKRGKFDELWWTSEHLIQTQSLTLVDISLEDDAFYKSHYLDENFGKAFLIKFSYQEARQFYKDIPFIFLWR